MRIATKTISGLYDGATTRELDKLSIQTAAALIVEEPEYSRLAARLLATYIDKEVANQEIHSFSQSIAAGSGSGSLNDASARLRRQQRAQAERRDRPSSATASNTSACARSTTDTCCAIRRLGR